MALAGILSVARDELICDMAETYHIYDLQALPVRTLAVLACGLGQNSRVWAKVNGFNAKWSDIVLAMCADRLAILTWFQTEDGAKGRNRPEMLTTQLMNRPGQSDKKKHYQTYNSGADFLAAWEAL